MRKSFLIYALAFFMATPALAAEDAEVLKPIHQFVDGFNKGDVKSALAACAEETSIIDEFPPYQWVGAGACAKWADDYVANAKKDAITEGVVKLHSPVHVSVDGDRAYVVVPTDYTWKQKGRPMKETRATLTFAMHKSAGGWKVVAWSWSAP